MGFNHASIVTPATAMLEAFSNANVQVIAFINFILGRQAGVGRAQQGLAHDFQNLQWRRKRGQVRAAPGRAYNNLRGRN